MPTSLAEVLIERGHANAAALILAGRVLVDGERENRAGIPVREDARIEILPGREYASRGAYKLLGAFDDFAHADPAQRICLDLGASHGGFTQVLLERGARVVYAIDVAYGILDYELRRDERVVPLEKRNARELAPDWLRAEDLRTAHENARGLFVTGDLSFISVRRILDALLVFRSAAAVAVEALLLVKPQFEQPNATEKGVMVDAVLRDAIVTDVIEYARGLGCTIYGVRPSRIPGAKGNQEYFLYCRI
jgi:23S rRNA (cytidine1920-2'-O)/16S rRNA (cytidine1409-2'-O)-methyltransferase